MAAFGAVGVRCKHAGAGWRHSSTTLADYPQRDRTSCTARGLDRLDGGVGDADGRLRAGLHRDGVHPNRAGYDVMRPVAEAAMQTALA